MTTGRMSVLLVMAILAAATIGCRRPASATGTAANGGAVGGGAAMGDYRTWSKAQIELLIQQKTGGLITLTSAGANKYRGTRPSPDGTIQIPVEVTVEAERILIEARGGGLSSRDVIDSQGRLHSDLR